MNVQASSPFASNSGYSGSTGGTLSQLNLLPDVLIDPAHLQIFDDLSPAEVSRINGIVTQFQKSCEVAQHELEEKRRRLEGVPPGAKSKALMDLKMEAMRRQNEETQIAKSRQQDVIRDIVRTHTARPVEHSHQEASATTVAAAYVTDSLMYRKMHSLYDSAHAHSQAKKDLKKIMDDGGNADAVRLNVKSCVSDPAHPLGKKLKSFTDEFRYIKITDKDSLMLRINKYRDSFTAEVEEFFSLNPKSEAHNIVVEIVTEQLAIQLNSVIIRVYNACFNAENTIANQKISAYGKKVTPAALDVLPALWLVDPSDPDPATASATAYRAPITTLRSITSLQSPYEKIHCVMNVLQDIGSRAQRFQNARGNMRPLEIGADDLARVFTFLLFKSGINNIFTEANIMQDFLTESMTCNEEGYCVTTFVICTQVINQMSF